MTFLKFTNLRAYRIRTIGLVCLFLVLWFGALEYRDLFHPDEGRYAEIPREMVSSSDWITPHLNDLKYFEKPVLQYWITAVAYRLLAEDEWTARLWPAVSGFLTLILVYFTGRRLAGVRAGLAAAAILASTFQFFLFSQVLTLDMGLTFFLTLALSSFLASQDTRCDPSQRRIWGILTWAAMALAVLSKGLVGVVLPGIVLLAYLVIERDWKLLGRLSLIRGGLVFLVIVLPWFVVVQLRNPEFFQFFFLREHFARFALNEHHRTGAWYYFIAVLLVGSLPWTFGYLNAFLNSWRSNSSNRFEINSGRLLVLWVGVITAFYSLSASKLPGYVLPVFPALALLLGSRLQHEEFRLSSRDLIGMGVSGAVIAIGAPFVAHIPKFAGDADLIVAYVPWAIAGGVTLIVIACVGWMLLRRRHVLVLPVLALGSLLAFQLLVSGTQSIATLFSSEDLVEVAQEKNGAFSSRVPFYSVGMYDQTLPLHIGRSLILAAYQGELAMGIGQKPERAIQTMEEFREQWLAQSQAYAIITHTRFVEEKNLGTPMFVLAANRKALIIARRSIPMPLQIPPLPTM